MSSRMRVQSGVTECCGQYVRFINGVSLSMLEEAIPNIIS